MQKHDFGKIGITIDGNYSPTKQYERLTYVRHNGKFWLSNQSTVGNEPTEESNYWMYIDEDNVIGDRGYPDVISGILYSDSWEGEEAPYTYDLGQYLNIAISSDYTNQDYNVYLDTDTATKSQLYQVILANIIGAGIRYIYAYGEKPTVDIPIKIYYYGS